MGPHVRKSGAFLALGFAGMAAGQPVVVYETGFESPPFSAGAPVSGVESWMTTAINPLTTSAQTATVKSGAQAAVHDGALHATGSAWTWRDNPFNPVALGTPVVDVSWDMNISIAGAVGLVGIDMYDPPVARITFVGVNGQNQVTYWNGTGTVPTTASVQRGLWYSYRVSLDYTTRKFDIFLDGAKIGSNLDFDPTSGDFFNDADLWKGGAGTNAQVFYDNFKIQRSAGCYPDCNTDGSLTVADFGCFQTEFVGATPYADCNGDGAHTVADFGCFQTMFVTGCP